MARRVVVIGAGIAGLATAALLQREGCSVTVLEAQSEVGGRARHWDSGGFRFDRGPSWFLMPEVFDHFYRLMGTSSDEQLDLQRLDPGYRVFAEGAVRPLDIADRATNIRTFDAIEPGAGERLAAHLDSAADTYQTAMRDFLYTTFSSLRPFLTGATLRQASQLQRMLRVPLDRFVAESFRTPVLQRTLSFPAVFLGSAPSRTPSLYHLMSHLDMDDGVWYPTGGIARVIETIEALARDAGAKIRCEAEVTAIETTGSGRRARVTGVVVRDAAGAEIRVPADVVVAAGDLHHIETTLLPPELQTYPESWWRKREPGPGGVLAYLGLRGKTPTLLHHNLFFVDDWERNLDAVFGGEASLPTPTSTYVCRPSATDVSVAPPDGENLFLFVPVPADPAIGHGGDDGRGDAGVEAIADAAIDYVAERAGIPDLRDRIVLRRTVGPADFERDLHAWRGGALGPGHTLRQSAFLRGRNASRTVNGLLYAGGSTIPGVGLPMCLISAELVVKRLRRDSSRHPLPEG